MSSKTKRLYDLILKDYVTQTRGSALRYLTDSMKRAVAAECAYRIMLTRYEVESERVNHTSPNEYVDAVQEVYKTLEL